MGVYDLLMKYFIGKLCIIVGIVIVCSFIVIKKLIVLFICKIYIFGDIIYFSKFMFICLKYYIYSLLNK